MDMELLFTYDNLLEPSEDFKLVGDVLTNDEYYMGKLSNCNFLIEMDGSGYGSSMVDLQCGKMWEGTYNDIKEYDIIKDCLGEDDSICIRKIIQVTFHNETYDTWCYFLNPKHIV